MIHFVVRCNLNGPSLGWQRGLVKDCINVGFTFHTIEKTKYERLIIRGCTERILDDGFNFCMHCTR